jgi:hypothetical protein
MALKPATKPNPRVSTKRRIAGLLGAVSVAAITMGASFVVIAGRTIDFCLYEGCERDYSSPGPSFVIITIIGMTAGVIAYLAVTRSNRRR